MGGDEIRQKLLELADEKYRKFASALVPTGDKMLGVRIPQLRAMARAATAADPNFFETCKPEFFEEKMIRGMSIAYANTDIETKIARLEKFVPTIGDWSICDSVCATFKFKHDELAIVKKFLEPLFESKREFVARFAYVALLDHFAKDEYIDFAIEKMSASRCDKYYAQIALAWAVSVFFVKFPERTKLLLETNALAPCTQNAALRKIRESLRVAPDEKLRIKKYVR